MRPKKKINFEASKYFQVKRGDYKFLDLYRLGLLDASVMRNFSIVDYIYRQCYEDDNRILKDVIKEQAKLYELTTDNVQKIWYFWTSRY